MSGVESGTMPTDDDIEEYFQEVENALITHGVRPKSGSSRERAFRVIKQFNTLEGPDLYPRVFDTEYRLESTRDDYILHGVVDVIANTDSGNPGDREIWDYKGQRRPGETSQELQNYKWQMCVYAQLYRARTGEYPDKAVLYFMNELDTHPPPTTRPVRALYEVNFTEDLIQEGIREFDQTAQAIMEHKELQEWPAPDDPPQQDTCDVCDIRWNCPAREGVYPIRYPVSDE